jgi:hypothetical protein
MCLPLDFAFDIVQIRFGPQSGLRSMLFSLELQRVPRNSELKVRLATDRAALGKQPVRIVVGNRNTGQCHLD